MRRACQGFSLLEILVAFVIMALALGVLMRVFSGVLRNVSVSERYAAALLIAESKLAALGVETPLGPLESQGETASGYHWLTRVAPVPDDTGYAEVMPIAGLFNVEVEVSWHDAGNKPRQVKLVSQRAGPLP